MAVNRVLFATQTARLYIPQTTGGTTLSQAQAYWAYLPAQSASADETIPQDDVLVMGKIDGVARLQKDVSTSKSSIKAYVASAGKYNNSPSTDWPGADTRGDSAELAHLFVDLEVSATEGKPCAVYTDSNAITSAGVGHDGFAMWGICSSISVDASKGGFPSIDLAFEGVGRLDVMGMGSDSSLANVHAGNASIKTLTPLISTNVSLGTLPDSTDTINSAKFSLDMPTETLSRMGGVIMGIYSNVKGDNKIFSKPPYKSSMTVDGQSCNAVHTQWKSGANGTKDNTITAGIVLRLKPGTGNGIDMYVDTAGASVSARSFSQNVGDVGATFSVSAEGTGAVFLVN